MLQKCGFKKISRIVWTVGLHSSGKAKIFWITGRSISLRYGSFFTNFLQNFWFSFSHFNTKHIAIIVIVVIIINCKQSVIFSKSVKRGVRV